LTPLAYLKIQLVPSARAERRLASQIGFPMIVIVGVIVVVGAVLGGFTMAGGHFGALIHPSEIVTIGGAALGGLIVGSPKKVLIDLMKGLVAAVKGSPYNKKAIEETFKCLYDLLRTARRDGMLALEPHLSKPEESSIFAKYPKVLHDHHLLHFICGGMGPLVDATVKPEQIGELLETELHIMTEEHHAPIHALQKTADALPGFGIVAAVLGIVITMAHIDGPPAEIGEKVGAALVGTFLGILLSYGFAAPLATRMESLGLQEAAFFKVVAAIIVGFANNLPPKVALEMARRSVSSEFRPEREELDEWFKEAEAA
jgi:chemotaxis protein MotA